MEAASRAAIIATKPKIKVAALCGSLRKASFHRGLIRSAIQLCNESIDGIQIEYLEIEPLPFINTDLEVNGTYPPVVEAFRQKILESDSILFASPEYNYSVAPPMKNAIDWASRPPNVWADKAAAIISTGGDFGGGRSQYHLRQIGVYLDLHFINKPELFVRAFQPPKKFDNDGNLIDPETKESSMMKTLLILVVTIGSIVATVPADATKSKFSLPKELKEKDDHGVADNNLHVRRKLSGGSNGVNDVKDSNPTVGNVIIGESNNIDTENSFEGKNDDYETGDYRIGKSNCHWLNRCKERTR